MGHQFRCIQARLGEMLGDLIVDFALYGASSFFEGRRVSQMTCQAARAALAQARVSRVQVIASPDIRSDTPLSGRPL